MKYEPTETRHLVRAAGGPADGSLYGFHTLCGQIIQQIDIWQEERERHPSRMCRRCLKIERWEDGNATGVVGSAGVLPPRAQEQKP